jgi:hypothetical protein
MYSIRNYQATPVLGWQTVIRCFVAQVLKTDSGEECQAVVTTELKIAYLYLLSVTVISKLASVRSALLTTRS